MTVFNSGIDINASIIVGTDAVVSMSASAPISSTPYLVWPATLKSPSVFYCSPG